VYDKLGARDDATHKCPAFRASVDEQGRRLASDSRSLDEHRDRDLSTARNQRTTAVCGRLRTYADPCGPLVVRSLSETRMELGLL
jgi:hypothetical protein